MKRFFHYLCVFCICFVGCAYNLDAQSSSSLKKQKKKTAERVRVAEQRLKANREAMRINLNELNSLDAEIAELDERVERLQSVSDSLTRIIGPLNDSIKVLGSRLEIMKDTYAKVLRNSYRNRTQLDALTFIFSASNFTQAWRRSQSLKQFSAWRARKASEIIDAKGLLEQQKLRLDSLSDRNRRVVSAAKAQRQSLAAKQAELTRLVKQIEASATDLQKEIDRRNKEMNQLDGQIENALKAEQQERLRAEAEAAKRNGEKKQDSTTGEDSKPASGKRQNSSNASAKDLKELTSIFESQKGKLPSPVQGKALIVKKFGRQPHPRLPKVYTENAGVDIQTDKGASVKAVCQGEVSQIFKLGGYNNVVVIRHGDFVTVYANVVDLQVSKGDTVAPGQVIGHVAVDASDNNRSVLHFEVRREKEKQDPEQWIRL